MVSKAMTVMAQHTMLALTCLAFSMAIAQPKPTAAEFSDLVKSLMVPVGSAPAPPDWNLGAHPALRWKSAAPQPARYVVKDGLPIARVGVVRITTDGQMITTQHGEPVQWEVTLAGSQTGPLEASLRTGLPMGSGMNPAIDLKAAGFRVRALCKPTLVSMGTELFALEKPGYRPVILAHEWGQAGRTGTHVELTLFYTKQRAAKLQCQ